MIGTFRKPRLSVPPPTIALFLSPVKAGFPSPAADYVDQALNLHELAVVNPAATVFCRISGDSMKEAGIFHGDLVVVDRSLSPQAGDLVLAILDEEFTLKRLEFESGRPILVPANSEYSIIRPREDQELTVFGVVRGLYRSLK